MSLDDKLCPCGKGASFELCCERFISGREKPETCEALMRSRYSAFTLAEVSYIRRTMKDKALQGFNSAATKSWAQGLTWEGLTVLRADQSGNRGEVEFCAKFQENGKFGQIHEISQFYCVGGQWYYVGGKS